MRYIKDKYLDGAKEILNELDTVLKGSRFRVSDINRLKLPTSAIDDDSYISLTLDLVPCESEPVSEQKEHNL